jgi:hypothetical protein
MNALGSVAAARWLYLDKPGMCLARKLATARKFQEYLDSN